MFKKVLVANRGEIALRVIRACKELGIKTVAIYSTVDLNSLHVKFADEAYLIGEAKPSESYLNIEKIIKVCKETGSEAIHPGYGFLAENAFFAKRCEEEGITFIGSNPEALEKLGDKINARQMMEKIGGSIIPGSLKPVKELSEAVEEADKIGYPVLLKASGGGGGRGMRLIKNKRELANVFESAKMEALKAFGNSTLYLEKKLSRPRHVEVQILSDKHGNVIHLFERECSIQRRHQKLLEETPSPVVDDEVRRKICSDAVKLVKEANYDNVCTIEFLRDEEGSFYFLEANTRIQVEHPITEMVTGVDIVKEQIKIAYGEEINLKQEKLILNGHAMECRIYAEDPERDFAPSSGKIESLRFPCGGWLRIESAVYPGFTVSPFYDALLVKLITWGRNREETIKRMRNALEEFEITGVKTNIPFFRNLVRNKKFIKGETHTQFINENKSSLFKKRIDECSPLIAAALNYHLRTGRKTKTEYLIGETKASNGWLIQGRRELINANQHFSVIKWLRNSKSQWMGKSSG